MKRWSTYWKIKRLKTEKVQVKREVKVNEEENLTCDLVEAQYENTWKQKIWIFLESNYIFGYNNFYLRILKSRILY